MVPLSWAAQHLKKAGTERNLWSWFTTTKGKGGNVMPLLIPVLIGIPVVIGGGWYIFHLAH
jgi:hypothetical protein